MAGVISQPAVTDRFFAVAGDDHTLRGCNAVHVVKHICDLLQREQFRIMIRLTAGVVEFQQ